MLSSRRVLAGIAAVSMIVASCGSDVDLGDSELDDAELGDSEFDDSEFDDSEFDDAELDDAELDDSEFDDSEFDDAEFDDAEFDGDGVAGGVDLSLERDDVDCSSGSLGSDDTLEFTVAHYVVDGALGAVCFGEQDPVLIEAWEALSVVTPSLQLADLGLFGAFAGTTDSDEVTLAFVNSLDADGSLFQMSVATNEYEADPEVGRLTMAHEFAHVFTSLPSQTDRADEGIDACATYFNGESCFDEDSLIFQWILTFWGDGLIDDIDPTGDASVSGGEERCANDAGFFGAYAASHPEEDFAEAFSAFVFQVEANSPEQQERLDWFASRPGLVEFSDRAVAAGYGPLANPFDRCG